MKSFLRISEHTFLFRISSFSSSVVSLTTSFSDFRPMQVIVPLLVKNVLPNTLFRAEGTSAS